METVARETNWYVCGESKDGRSVYLPSVECTWASVMRNQQKVCSFHREHAMVPGVDGLWQVCVVTKRL